ncbi:hypothetical protein BWZ22_05025 [Seonamhaeicola sp. S2-3]|uniref:hypothetical protein n=1 Tax=Seonamhaeicola sp. S2-3 TaxID=1936081 RepID=UPI000972AF13|nr:hypothetical protein [Seonamhaeicola sp. S2-3]APY10641.1 hypothetical protein BWZ22_05025 [Seonamhaeicola sp. S2-3]
MKKPIRATLLIIFVLTGLSVFSQEVILNQSIYQVNKNTIFKEGVDVTNDLSKEEKSEIFKIYKKQQKDITKIKKAQKKAEKEQEKAEKKVEKKKKQAEKALKKKEKAQANYDKAIEKHEAALSKYEKLKNKGKLSPVAEAKWKEKIAHLKTKIAKAQKKLE